MTINKFDYINYRFKRAQESYDEALIMIENKRWNTAITDYYYCDYAVIALLLKKRNPTSQVDAQTNS